MSVVCHVLFENWVLTSGSVESTTTSIALEMLGFLVRDKKLEILKVTFACQKSALDHLCA